eukprot:5738532-Prymnesium_polylepis.1
MAQRHEGARHLAAVRSLHYRKRTARAKRRAPARRWAYLPGHYAYQRAVHVHRPLHRCRRHTHAKSGKRKTVR